MNDSPDLPTTSRPTQHLRYVVLRHQSISSASGSPPDVHWDLMLELPNQEKLATWQIRTPLEAWSPPDPPPAATRIADHRPIYLTYEGPLTQDRGTVTRVAAGTWSLTSSTPSTWHIQLRGSLTAVLALPANQP